LQDFKRILADRLIEENSNLSLDDLTESALLMLSDSSPSSAVASRRQHVFRRTIELLHGLTPGENPSVSEICKAINCSISTLERAFREELGVGPKGYLLTQRLNAVRRDLLNADPDERVSQIAIRWGFWHMGKFAADYRLAFGELPSQSLSARPPNRSK
jgi:AraC family ethanolamine operon transcriptional activator